MIGDNNNDSDQSYTKKTYKQSINMILDDKSRKSILLPPGVGNGFYVLSHKSVFHYKWSYKGKYLDKNKQYSYRWNDPKLRINWPIKKPILSSRDKKSKFI